MFIHQTLNFSQIFDSVLSAIQYLKLQHRVNKKYLFIASMKLKIIKLHLIHTVTELTYIILIKHNRLS